MAKWHYAEGARAGFYNQGKPNHAGMRAPASPPLPVTPSRVYSVVSWCSISVLSGDQLHPTHYEMASLDIHAVAEMLAAFSQVVGMWAQRLSHWSKVTSQKGPG